MSADNETQDAKNKRLVRCPVLLDPYYSAEKAVLDTLEAVPGREKAFFLRELVLRGLGAVQTNMHEERIECDQ